MPLSFKTLIAQLKTKLKDGEELPEGLEGGVWFESDDAFVAAAHAKVKPQLSEAQKNASKAAAEARAAGIKETLGKLNIDPERLDEVAAEIASMGETKTEYEKLKGVHDKLAKDSSKEIKRLTEENTTLKGFQSEVIRTKALAPHLLKFREDVRDEVGEVLMSKLVINDKGEVVGPEGKTVEAFVGEKLTAKPSLKASDYKPGAGTAPNAGKTDTKPTPKPGEGQGDGGAGGGSGGRPTRPVSEREQLRTSFRAALEGQQPGGDAGSGAGA